MAKPKPAVGDATPLSSNPFAALSLSLPDGPEPTAEPPAAPTPAAPGLAWGGKVVVRRQKKGQGGKAATFVDGLPAPTREALRPRVKRALGCGARVDEAALVVGTGDHRRVAQWLEGLGAPTVVLGN